MKSCAYCGRENQHEAKHCCECGLEFRVKEEIDPRLTDPHATLITLAVFADLVHAVLLKADLEAAGIEACIPEDLAPNLFGHFFPLARITVQVAAKDYEAAKEILATRTD